jgi:anti-sigma regulatory factor (Ser/Thr protein kinase)
VIAERQFAAEAGSVPAARHFVREVLRGVGRDRLDLVALMVSELATNCVLHARSPFTVRLETSARDVRIEATDSAAGLVEPRTAGPTDLHGRGLRIVETLSDTWGVDRSPLGGKTVWFCLGLQDVAVDT